MPNENDMPNFSKIGVQVGSFYGEWIGEQML